MKNDNSRNPDCPNFASDGLSFTQGIMECFIENLREQNPSKYEVTSFLRFSEKLLGIDKCAPEYYDRSIDFWNHLAFYNFVQTASGATKSAEEYKAKDRNDSSHLADEVVEALQPDYVIVWGSRAFGYWKPAEYIDRGGWMTITLKSGKLVKAIRLSHPSRGIRQKDFELLCRILVEDHNTSSLTDMWSNNSEIVHYGSKR